MDYDGVSALIESVTSKYGEMQVIKASVELQEHKERIRGVPLVLARIRLVTDRGYFTADGEGYGATHALRLAANAVERQLLKGKTYGQSMKRRDVEEQEKLYGWWLGGWRYQAASPLGGFGKAFQYTFVDGHDWSLRMTKGADGGARFGLTGAEFPAVLIL